MTNKHNYFYSFQKFKKFQNGVVKWCEKIEAKSLAIRQGPDADIEPEPIEPSVPEQPEIETPDEDS